MLEEHMNIKVTIQYNNNEDAKLELIKFFVDYYLEKNFIERSI